MVDVEMESLGGRLGRGCADENGVEFDLGCETSTS